YAFENALYLDVEQKLSEKIQLSYGLRYSTFLRLGQDELNMYANNEPVVFNQELQIYEKAEPIGIEKYKRSKVLKSFGNFEPRLAIAYQLQNNSSIKASYNRLSQYLHLLSNT